MASYLDELTDEPEPQRAQKTFEQDVVDSLQSIFPMAGSILGGVAGTALGPLGAVGGAGLGYELGERTARLGQSIADYLVPVPPQAQTALGQQMRQPTTPLGELGRTAKNLGIGATAEMGGQAIGGTIKGAAGALSKRLPAALPGARATQAELQTVGSRLTPAQFTENRAIDVMEGIAEGALLGGPIDAVKKGQQGAVQALVDRALADVDTKMGVRGVSAFLEDAVRGRRTWGKALQRAAYKEVDAAAGAVKVDTGEFVTFVEDALTKNQTNVKRALDAAVPNWRQVLIRPESQATLIRPVETVTTKTVTSPIADALGRPITSEQVTRGMREVSQITGVPGANEATFSEVANARSALLRISRKKALAPEDEVVTKTAGLLASKLDSAIEDSAQKLAPDALRSFREANALTKRVEQTFNNETVRAVIRKLSREPAKLFGVLMKPQNVDVLERVRDAAPGAWPTIQSKLAERSLLRAVDPAKGGQFNGNNLLKFFKQLGDETAETAYGTETFAALKRLAETDSFVQAARPAGEGAGSMVIKLAQGGAMVTLAMSPFLGFQSGRVAAGTGAMLLGPYVMGKLMANPKAIHLLADGLKPGITVEQTGRLAAQLAAYTVTGQAPPYRAGGLSPSRSIATPSLLDQLTDDDLK